MAVTAFSLGTVAKLAQSIGAGNVKGNGNQTYSFTAQATGVAIVAIASGGCGYSTPNIRKGNDIIANSGHSGHGNFWQTDFDWYNAAQYAGGFATKTFPVKKGDEIHVWGGAGEDGGGFGTVSVNFFVVK